MRSQCPVSTQTQTMNSDKENENNSAPVNRPHMPNEILKMKNDISQRPQRPRKLFYSAN